MTERQSGFGKLDVCAATADRKRMPLNRERRVERLIGAQRDDADRPRSNRCGRFAAPAAGAEASVAT